jgi:hypothetical protein
MRKIREAVEELKERDSPGIIDINTGRRIL